MAQYKPSFVDVSGLTQGISRGLEIAAEKKKQQDALAEARLDDFLKMYQPGKLREQDIPDFTSAYSNYKQAALNFSKINRGGGAPEELASAKANMDKALGNLNSIYSKSAVASNKMADYAQFISTARSKGYEIPNEVNTNFNLLSSRPISLIDVDKIAPASSFDLLPKTIDFDAISKTLDNMGARIKEIDTKTEQVPYTKDVSGKQLYATNITKYVGRPAKNTVDSLSRLSKVDARLMNGIKEDYNLFMQGVANNSPATADRFDEIKEYFPEVKTPQDVLPEMVFGLQFYRKQSQGSRMETGQAELEYRRAKDVAEIAKKKESEGESAGQYVDLYGNISELLSRPTQPTGAPVSRLDVTGQQAVVNVAQNATNSSIGAQDLYMRINPNTGRPTLYSSVDVFDRNSKKVLGANQPIGELTEDINIEANKALGTKAKIKSVQTKQPAVKQPAKKTYQGLDSQGNPIYK
jgi:hypothetical protein